MENEEETVSLSLAQIASERGAGGKYRKPPSRKPTSTPYARPQPRSRWLSKLVDPACRFISGGATRIFPSLFSNYPEYSLPAFNNQEQDEDKGVLNTEAEENTEDDGGLNHGESISIVVSDSSCPANRSKNGSEFDRCKLGKRGDTTDDELSEIEQLIKGKTFSRDEINHLIEIIRSRDVDLSEQENKYLSMTMKADAERSIAAFENSRKSIEGKQEDLSKAKWGTSTTLLRSSAQVEVGASPIEIAKAYMGNRTSEVGLGTKSTLSKDERATLTDDEFTLKSFVPPISPKPSTCWPGAMLPDQCGYLTPQNERGRTGLHNFSRTPYSRTIFSKSKSKLSQGNGNRGLNTSTPLQHLQTPTYGQSRRNTQDNGHGSVGPIRRIQHKVEESPARGSINFNSSLNGTSWVGNSSISEGLFPAVKKNLELVGASSSSMFQAVDRKSSSLESGVPPVHPHSSQIARTILEHLERNPATPKDKSAELELATLWKKPQVSNNTTAIPSERNSFLPLGGVDSCKKTEQGEKKNSAHVNEAGVNSLFKVPPQENAKEPKDTVDDTSSASVVKADSIYTIQQGCSTGMLENFSKTRDFEINSKNENDSETVPNAADGKVLNLQRKPPSHSVGAKLVLPSISVEKPNQSWTFSSDNGFGFTFPVSKSTGASSEPPTPSILPSCASGEHQPEDGHAVPSYSFGLSQSTPLIFAFPSTSNAPPSDDASDLKFNFGSNKTRISFNSMGKDAICF